MRNHVALFVAAAACSGAHAQLQNPSFELPGGTTIFQGWENFENAFPEFGVFRTGAVSVKLFGNFGLPYNAAGVYQSVPAAPGQAFEASAWSLHSASDPMQGTNFGAVNIEWIDGVGGQLGFVSSRATDSTSTLDEWRQTTVTGTAPAGTVSARLVLLHIQGPELLGGSVFFDDAAISQTSITGLPNAGFEEAGTGTPFTFWNHFGNVFGDAQIVHSGSRAAKMYGNWSGPYNASGVFQDFPTQEGESWRGSAWVATVAADRIGTGNFAVLNVEWRDVAGNLISFVSAPAADPATQPDVWHQVTIDATAPAGAVVARVVLLHIQGPEQSGGAVWWDDVEFGLAGGGPACDPDVNCDGSPDQGDVACMILAVAGDVDCICQDPDFNLDGSADQGDVAAIIGVVAGQPCP